MDRSAGMTITALKRLHPASQAVERSEHGSLRSLTQGQVRAGKVTPRSSLVRYQPAYMAEPRADRHAGSMQPLRAEGAAAGDAPETIDFTGQDPKPEDSRPTSDRYTTWDGWAWLEKSELKGAG